MMYLDSNIAIEVSNLSKSYRLYEKPSGRIKEILFNSSKEKYAEKYALKDLSFCVGKGNLWNYWR